MRLRTWISISTLVLIAIILFFSRHALERAWVLLGTVNLWMLVLIIPLMALGYYATGEMIFSYLRQKNLVGHVSPLSLIRISMEINFVNHVFPSGGVSGISYTNWRLSKIGVQSSKVTMAQVVRFSMSMLAYTAMIMLAVLMVTIDGSVNRWIILVSSTLATGMLALIIGLMYLMGGQGRMKNFASISSRLINKMAKKISFGKISRVVVAENVEKHLQELHEDYDGLMRDKKLLLKPFLWGVVVALADIMIYYVGFLSLGIHVNPAPILIGYTIATLAAFAFVTPGGAGAYETIMATVLAISGIAQGAAIAGVVMIRAILLIVTIAGGYALYQHALIKYGKDDDTEI